MTNSNRTIEKNKITSNDITWGENTEQQSRNGQSYVLPKVRSVYPVNTNEELSSLKPIEFPKVNQYSNGLLYNYRYNGAQYYHTPVAARVDELDLPYTDLPAAGREIIVLTASENHTLSSISGGVKGQRIHIVKSNANLVIEHNSSISLKDDAFRTLRHNEGITLVNIDGNVWVEV